MTEAWRMIVTRSRHGSTVDVEDLGYVTAAQANRVYNLALRTEEQIARSLPYLRGRTLQLVTVALDHQQDVEF